MSTARKSWQPCLSRSASKWPPMKPPPPQTTIFFVFTIQKRLTPHSVRKPCRKTSQFVPPPSDLTWIYSAPNAQTPKRFNVTPSSPKIDSDLTLSIRRNCLPPSPLRIRLRTYFDTLSVNRGLCCPAQKST